MRRAVKSLSGERGVGGKCPNAGVPTPGTGEPSVAAVAGVRNAPPPVPLDGPGTYELGKSPSPAGVPGKPPAPPDDVRPETGGGTVAGEDGEYGSIGEPAGELA